MRSVEFPYGTAPLLLLIAAMGSGALLLLMGGEESREADLSFVVFAKEHYEAYRAVIPAFEAEHNVSVNIEQVDMRVLESRLQAALLSGSAVPDLVELENGAMGFFTKGPIRDVGFVDLTDRLQEEGYYARMVESRFSLWSSRGRVFGLPHDVHPVMLAYRRDIVEDELGIDVSTLTTWEDFAAVGRQVTGDHDGDGVFDRYMIDMTSAGEDFLEMLIIQRGGGLFNAAGELTLHSEIVIDTIIWYIHQTRGPDRIAFPAGWGQPLSRAMLDGFVLFYFTPDWRTRQFEMDVPSLAGKMALMPLPAWEEGGRRTSTWGGTGLCITKASDQQELAWEFAKFLYLQPDMMGDNFLRVNIIPPLKDAWDLPEFHQSSDYYSGQSLGDLYSSLAPEVPANYSTAYSEMARQKLVEAFVNSAAYFEQHGNEGLTAYVRAEVKRVHDLLQRTIDNNRFMTAGSDESGL